MKKKHQIKRFLQIVLLASVLIFPGCGRDVPTVSDPVGPVFTEIKGTIRDNLTFDKSPYYVIEDIFIDSAQSIVIEQGVDLLFFKDKRFYINGNLFALGSKEEPIRFTGHNDSTWGGIKISNSANSEFRFCVFEKIDIEDDDITGTGSVKIEGSNIKFLNCIFRGNRSANGGAIYTSQSSCVIMNSIFNGNFSVVAGGAILSEVSIIEVINNTFYNNNSFNFGGGIVLYMCESLKIHNNIFYKNTSQTGDPRIVIVPDSNAINDTAYNFLAFGNLNPDFVSENDFHLKAGSHCIDAGNPAELYNDFDGSRNDQGAYGGRDGNW